MDEEMKIRIWKKEKMVLRTPRFNGRKEEPYFLLHPLAIELSLLSNINLSPVLQVQFLLLYSGPFTNCLELVSSTFIFRLSQTIKLYP